MGKRSEGKRVWSKDYLADQLRCPSGHDGLIAGRMMNCLNREMNRVVFERLKPNSRDHILEAGFGGGALLKDILAIDGVLVSGIDLSSTMASRANQRFSREVSEGRLEARQGSIESLPYSENTFTKICSVNTLYFCGNTDRAFALCRRVLKPEGLLVVCVNEKQGLEEGGWDQHGFVLYTTESLKSLFTGAGFQNIDITEHDDPKQGKFLCASATA